MPGGSNLGKVIHGCTWSSMVTENSLVVVVTMPLFTSTILPSIVQVSLLSCECCVYFGKYFAFTVNQEKEGYVLLLDIDATGTREKYKSIVANRLDFNAHHHNLNFSFQARK